MRRYSSVPSEREPLVNNGPRRISKPTNWNAVALGAIAFIALAGLAIALGGLIRAETRGPHHDPSQVENLNVTGNLTALKAVIQSIMSGNVAVGGNLTVAQHALITQIWASHVNATEMSSHSLTVEELAVIESLVTSTINSTTQITTPLVMTDMVMNSILVHEVSGVIPPTHAKQLIQNDPLAPPPASVPQLSGLPLGTITTAITQAGDLYLLDLANGPWRVVDLAADPYTSISDTPGTRVIVGGLPNVWGGSENCGADAISPTNGQISSLKITPVGVGGILQLNFRYSTEPDYDFAIVRKNDEVIHSGSGIGPSSTNNAFVEIDLSIVLGPSDSVTITFLKDSSCFAGYDMVYFYMSLTTSPSLSMTLPADLTSYIGKEFQVCSVDLGRHSLSLASPVTFDSDGYWNRLIFQGNGASACCITFFVTANDKLTITSRNPCSVFCNNPNHCVDPERPEQTNQLHGWWRQASKAFFGSSYGYLDTTKVPMQFDFKTIGPTTYRIESSSPGVLQLYAVGNGILSTSSDPNLYDPEIAPTWYQVQPGSTRMVSSTAQGVASYSIEYPNIINQGLYEKVQEVPPIVPNQNPSLDGVSLYEPQEILRRFFQIFVYQAFTILENESSETWVGYTAAKASLDEIISTGKSHSDISIIRTLATHALNPEKLTEFRTEVYHHVSPVGYVTISGFTDACALLNGVHLVAAAATTNNAETNGLFQDYGSNASARTVHHTVGIHFDSSAIPVFPGTNTANCTGSLPVLSISYGPINANTNYINFVSAWWYWFYENVKIGLHTRPRIYFDRSSLTPASALALPRVEWSEVASDVSGDNPLILGIISRVRGSVSPFHNNALARIILSTSRVTLTSRGFSTVTDLTGPFGIRPDLERSRVRTYDSTERGTFWFHIAANNYLQNISYPAWKMIGTSRSHPNNLFAQLNYPGGEGDEFDTIMVPFGQLPPTEYSYIDAIRNPLPNGGFSYPYEEESNFINEHQQEQFFMGRINPSLTNGVNVGYIRLTHSAMFDTYYFMNYAQFCPTGLCNSTSPRNNHEAALSVYAKYMQYLVVDLDCEHIIIDIRGNSGGSAMTQPRMAEFFGSEEYTVLDYAYGTKTDNGWGDSFDMKAYLYPDGIIESTINTQRVFPSMSETNYPGSVFTGGNLVLLDDTMAGSGGDIFPNCFLGPSLDKRLGSDTNVSIIGSVDGRLSGYACFYTTPEFPSDSPRLKTSSGTPVSPFDIPLDCGSTVRRNDGSSLGNRHPGLEIDPSPTLTGLSGSNALPEDWEELVYKDLGFITNTRPRLVGDTRPQTATVLTEVNPLSTVSGSNVVTVTTSAPHGFFTGNSIALGSGADPVATVSNIPGFALTGGHVITVINATAFTFEAAGEADYSCYPLTNCATPTPANTTTTGVGGTIRIMNRSQWRDAWLEQAILKAIATPAKKKKRTIPLKKKQRVVGKFDLHKARQMYGRDVTCPQGVHVTRVQSMNATRTVVVDLSQFEPEDPARQKAIQAAGQQVTKCIVSELKNGGMCLDSQGALMATPSCTELVKIHMTHGKNSAFDSYSKKRRRGARRIKK